MSVFVLDLLPAAVLTCVELLILIVSVFEYVYLLLWNVVWSLAPVIAMYVVYERMELSTLNGTNKTLSLIHFVVCFLIPFQRSL